MTKELAIAKKTLPIVEEAKKVVIKNDKDMTKATEILSRLNKAADAADAEKNKVMRPLLDAVNAERGRWKPLETELKAGIDHIRKVMTVYRTEQKKTADEEAARIEARVGSGKGKLKAETAIAKMADIEQPEENIIADSGMVKFRTVNVFEIEDIGQILDATGLQFIDVSLKMRAVEEALKRGEKIPGIKYSTEERPVNSR